jgi:hypothetical protein
VVAVLVVVAVAVAAVWLAGDGVVAQVAATALLVAGALGVILVLRQSQRAATAVWRDAVELRRELGGVHHQLVELRSQHQDLLAEVRSLRIELVAASQDTARSIQAATDQQAVLQHLLVPRQPVPDPVYPSMHLPLLRKAFATELPSTDPVSGIDDKAFADSYPDADETVSGEPFPSRPLLDLTASEIARLRPAN